MNILPLPFPKLKAHAFSPLQSFDNWPGAKPVVCNAAVSNTGKALTRRPLRVVRIMESGQPSSQIGRMLISGSFSDVCAELDRMADQESSRH